MTSEEQDRTVQTVVRLDGVRKEYGDARALDDVTLEIRAGEAVAVMGPSGCGKSTLLNMIAGLDRPSSGTVTVHGEDLGALNETGLALFRSRRIGMIFQFFNLIDDLTALDNVALAAQLTGSPAAQARRRALELSCRGSSAAPSAPPSAASRRCPCWTSSSGGWGPRTSPSG
ncbi:ABC transporter ATP-binding protein [Streptomyces sp. NPDC004609]|uniref:ABC transporter ATP-binding protein n=1 Tax=Streptomyces sp. NPDC004609 TaxID=3364704 RepID=UPI0036BDA2ED